MAENENPQNDYFLRRVAKEKEVRNKKIRKTAKTFLIWTIGVVVVGVGTWWLVSGSQNRPDVVEAEGEFFAAQSRQHIASGESHPAYNTNPPTGGWHYGNAVQTGIYDQEFPDEQLIHNLEHGHIWIAYRPDLGPETVEKLAEIAKSYSSKIIVTPRVKNDTAIALSAWEYLLKLEQFDEGAIQGFIKQYRGKGPENIPDFGFKDFRVK